MPMICFIAHDLLTLVVVRLSCSYHHGPPFRPCIYSTYNVDIESRNTSLGRLLVGLNRLLVRCEDSYIYSEG